MRLNQKEWTAVVIAMFVVGFFFLFGGNLISAFRETSMQNQTQSKLILTDEIIGTGEEAAAGDRVTVNYTGHFVNGDIFDSSVARGEPFQFVLGAGQVIEGWDKGILGMRVGGKRTLSVPPEFGYGSKDYGPIPGGSTLIFDVELLKVEKGQ